MEKLEKVIRALECCVGDADCDFFCPYWTESETSDETACGLMRNDALELLKAQSEKLDILRAELAEERERSARWVRESEPVVHAHWEKFRHPSGTHGIRCSHCQTTNGRKSNYCPECGAIMDEKVFEPTPIGKLLFSMRVHKRLKSAGILTMEQLAETDKQTLHNIEGLGKQSILEIEEKLAEWQKERNKNG